MKVAKLVATAVVPVVLVTALALPALAAEQPTTTIKKTVQNQTTNTIPSDANDVATALSVKTGDILKYVITITNTAPQGPDAPSLNSGKLTDNLPAGIELVSDPEKRQITEDLGTIKPGASVTKQFLVRVTAGKDGDVVTNKACFTGKYTTDGAQNGCDDAVFTIGTVETPEPTPVPATPAPTTPAPAPTAPAGKEDLPTTGPIAIVAPIAAVFALAFTYAARMFVFTRNEQR